MLILGPQIPDLLSGTKAPPSRSSGGRPKKGHRAPQAPLTGCPASAPRPALRGHCWASLKGDSTARAPPRAGRTKRRCCPARENATCRARGSIGREQRQSLAVAQRVGSEDTGRADGAADWPLSAGTNHLAPGSLQPGPPPLATPHPLPLGRSRASGWPFPLCPGRPAHSPHGRGFLPRREPGPITRQPETQGHGRLLVLLAVT